MLSFFKILTISALFLLSGRATVNPSVQPPANNFIFGSNLVIGPGSATQVYYTRTGQTLANPINYPAAGRGVLVVFGQSNFSNVNPTTYVPANSNVFVFSNVDSAVYVNSSPTLGTSTGAPLGIGCTAIRIADALITNGNFTSVIVANSAIGGTLISPVWSNDSFGMIKITFARLAAAGLTPTAVLFGQGEGDTGAGTSQAAYAAGLSSFFSNVRAAGFNGPIFVAHQSWNLGSTSANVTNAQDAAVNHGAAIWAGPNGDAINAAGRQADNTHFNDAGAATYSSSWITALHAFGAPFMYTPPFAANDNWQALEGCNDNTADMCKAM